MNKTAFIMRITLITFAQMAAAKNDFNELHKERYSSIQQFI
jgi:hypothetical protein